MVLLLSSLLPDDRMTMSVLPVSCEIVELTETPYCESKISESTGKQTGLKKPIEEDIDKLFEAIVRGSFRGRRFANLSYKNAMKRPMRVIPPQVLSNGISDSICLKQAFRGLCISQASEMAAAKKRSCKPSASEAGAIWKLRWAVGPKRGSSKISTKALEYEHLAEIFDKREEVFVLPNDVSLQSAEITKSGTVAEIATFETGHGSEHEETLELPDSSFGMDKQVPKSCKILPTPGKSSVQDKSKFTSLSSNDNVGVEIVKGSKLGSMKLNMLVKNFVKKKIATKEFLEDERSRSTEKGNSSQSSKNSTIGECSSTTSYSGESYPSTSTPNGYRHYMSGDLRWKAIGLSEKQHGKLSLKHFKLLRKVGAGDIGTVYVAQLIGTSCLFAIKVVDKELLISRKKLQRAQTEIEILEIVEHPFLPTLYAHLTTNKYSCLIMEYCPGGNLHMLRQNQLTKSFSEKAMRFYVAEVVLALEYLHMLGVVYRDLKPENILLGEDGHIMLSDFNSSVRCTVTPLLLNSSSPNCEPPKISSCINPFCLQPSLQLSCFTSRELKSELSCQIIPLPQLVVEPTTVHSDSFVGTHEYLAPEIIKGECHGSAVDWWTVGILLYELLYGTTPFTGASNKDTINNVVLQALKFPASPVVSSRARDLIRRLLKKEPETRLGSAKGAGEIKMHPFFEGLNWALIRCETPPELPKLSDTTNDEAKKNHGSRMREFREEVQCHEEDEFVMMF